MKTNNRQLPCPTLIGTRFVGIVSLLFVLLGTLAGCSGGTSPFALSPARFAGHYTGSFSATYDPHAPLSGTISGPVDFTVAPSGVVTLTNPFSFPPDPPNLTGTGTVDAQGAITASAVAQAFSILSLTGQLRLNADGSITGGGAITVVAASELAYGTWQATLQPNP